MSAHSPSSSLGPWPCAHEKHWSSEGGLRRSGMHWRTNSLPFPESDARGLRSRRLRNKTAVTWVPQVLLAGAMVMFLKSTVGEVVGQGFSIATITCGFHSRFASRIAARRVVGAAGPATTGSQSWLLHTSSPATLAPCSRVRPGEISHSSVTREGCRGSDFVAGAVRSHIRERRRLCAKHSAIIAHAEGEAPSAVGKRRVIFLGSPECVNSVLSTLVEATKHSDASFDLPAVVTQPPKPVGRKKVLTKTPIHELAEQLGVETILVPDSARDDEFLERLEALEPDLCITAAYGQYLPKRFLEAPRLGTLNLHPSLLPLWRGASPVQRSLEAGDSETGITILYTVKKMDAGPIALQRSCKLQGNEISGDMLNRLFKWGAELLVDEVLPRVFSGELSQATAMPQDENLVTKAALIRKEEGRLWPHNETALQMCNKIRGFASWPGTTLPIACTGSAAPPQGYRAKVFGVNVISSSTLPAADLEKPVEELVYLPGGDGRNDSVAVRPATDPDNVLLLETFHLPGKPNVLQAQTFSKGYMQTQPARWTWPEEEERLAAEPKKKKARKS